MNNVSLQQLIENSFEFAKRVAIEQGLNRVRDRYYCGPERYIEKPLREATEYWVQGAVAKKLGITVDAAEELLDDNPLELAKRHEIDLAPLEKRIEEVEQLAQQHVDIARNNPPIRGWFRVPLTNVQTLPLSGTTSEKLELIDHQLAYRYNSGYSGRYLVKYTDNLKQQKRHYQPQLLKELKEFVKKGDVDSLMKQWDYFRSKSNANFRTEDRGKTNRYDIIIKNLDKMCFDICGDSPGLRIIKARAEHAYYWQHPSESDVFFDAKRSIDVYRASASESLKSARDYFTHL